MSKKMSKKLTIIILIILGLFGVSGTFFLINQQKADEPKIVLENNKSISYSGKDGSTVIELLKAGTKDVEVNGEGKNAFVVSINGVKSDPTNNKYWMFFVNGQSSEVGAGSYVTKNSDIIKWELTSF